MSIPTAPRRRWPWILVAAIAVVVAAVLVIYLAVGHPDPAPTPTTPSTSAPSSTPSSSDAAPTGCLGGAKRDAAMVLAAVSAAPHSSNGAVEVAAAFTRWIQRYPYPSAEEARSVGDGVLANKSFTDDLPKYLAGSPDLSGGIVPAGETYYMSTVPGVWSLDSVNGDTVVATIGTAFVVKGVLSTTLRSSITVTLDWEDGSWRIANADGTQTTEQLFASGHAFTAGC